ncbi:hypothetical protein BZZ01_16615 [Nostocales cyanobacterium HT-58-2]|nr:hypothetical protein BZZ01_16615 [Nostocales cyanobacterium HT-58-2]
MFELLSRVLLWLLVGTIIYTLFQRFYPSGTFVGRLVLVIMLLVILLSFINPNEPAVASLWRVVSFPLKPLGASILLMVFAAQRMKKGGTLDAPGGYLIGWALTILLLSSTPAFAYFLVRSPVAMVGEPYLANQEIVQNVRLASSIAPATSTSETLVALGQNSTITSDGIISASRMSDVVSAPYLLQTPQDIRRRGLRLEDFVPNAEMLQITTRVWETYLNQIYFFLRGR